MKIGMVIRKRREALRLNLEQFGGMIGMDAGNLSKLERGKQSYTPERLEAIAAALNTTPAQLLAESETTAKQAPSQPPTSPEKEERDLLRNFWQLDPANRAALQQITAAMARSVNSRLVD